VGTLNLLEAARQACPESPFVHMSTNKVYGDAPNRIALHERPTRWDFADPRYVEGIDESLTIDQSTHSLFGASKVAADVLVQEYGRYFGMKTVCFRGGCLTGTGHSGAELHGFLAYLVKTLATGRRYTIFGYKGKQVRDQIHSRDVVLAFESFRLNPKSGAVYNLGGGKANSVSVLEAIDRFEQLVGIKIEKTFSDQARTGDHICYYTDLRRFQNDYPEWRITTGLDQIFEEFVVDFASGADVAA
jgi:CDP-paratose 2-epimerase